MSKKMDIKGFNLLELLAAISVLVIVAAIAIPSYLELHNNNKLRSASEEIYHKLLHTKSEAIKRNANSYTVFQTGSTWCVGFDSNATCNCSVSNNCDLGAIQSSNFPDVTLGTSSLSSGNFTFDNVRGTSSDSGTFILTLSGKSVDVTVSSMGRIGICSNTIGGYQTC